MVWRAYAGPSGGTMHGPLGDVAARSQALTIPVTKAHTVRLFT